MWEKRKWSTSSPHHYHRQCMENSIENMYADIRVQMDNILIPLLILVTCCMICSFACLMISSNCCAWNVWNCFSWFSSAFNIRMSPRRVHALTSRVLLSFTRPLNQIFDLLLIGLPQCKVTVCLFSLYWLQTRLIFAPPSTQTTTDWSEQRCETKVCKYNTLKMQCYVKLFLIFVKWWSS